MNGYEKMILYFVNVTYLSIHPSVYLYSLPIIKLNLENKIYIGLRVQVPFYICVFCSVHSECSDLPTRPACCHYRIHSKVFLKNG